MNDATQGTIEDQLETLYGEREWLAQELGCCDAESIVDMVRNLESQLVDLYKTYGSSAPVSSAATMQLLNHVQELSSQLDGMYSEKSVTFQIEDDKPVLKATWKQVTNQNEGDSK